MRVCLFSERLSRPFDEGIKNYVRQLAMGLARDHDVLTLTTFGESVPLEQIRNVRANRLLLSRELSGVISEFEPDLVVYVPTACATLFSFLRSRVLRRYAGGVPIVLVALQVRQYGRLARLLMPRLRPDLTVVQSELTQRSLEGLAAPMRVAMPGVDLERFRPVPAQRRRLLRGEFGISPGDYVILHVGHLNRGRNLQSLLGLGQHSGEQIVVVGSTSTPQDQSLVAELRLRGVRVIDRYVREIAQVYQMADCYVFPVRCETSAIDVPLSVLEAMACDLPVVTTPFGGLPSVFEAQGGLRYLGDDKDLRPAVDACKDLAASGTRDMVAAYAWPRVADRLLAMAKEELDVPPRL